MFDALAKLLGIRSDQAEDAIRSERAARATLDRRGFLKFGAVATGALATGAIWSMPAVEAPTELVSVVTAVDHKAGTITITSFDRLLKEMYQDDRVEKLIYENSPFLSAIRRDEITFSQPANFEVGMKLAISSDDARRHRRARRHA